MEPSQESLRARKAADGTALRAREDGVGRRHLEGTALAHPS